ncbi:MAG: hypothetical protein IPK61_04500 [Saprospiraceae bacterium]|nr:hypothetical protein [Saprospiraceae bacterium]MBK9378485.1 hypothetical protein [Saprospiraceae bacterium]
MMTKIKSLLIFQSLCFCSVLFGQSELGSSQEIWLGAGIDVKLDKSWQTGFNLENRSDPTLFHNGSWVSDISLTRRLNKSWNAQIAGRFTTNNKRDKTRYSLATSFKDKFNQAKFKSKAAFFFENKLNEYCSTFFQEANYYTALESECLFPIWKKKIYIGPTIELRNQWQHRSVQFELLRLGISSSFEFAKHHSIEVFSFLEFENLFFYSPAVVSGVNYQLDLDLSKLKKKKKNIEEKN